MSLRKAFSNFFINGCGLRRLHGGALQKFTRAALDEIDLQHLRDAHHCPCFPDRAEMYGYIHRSRFNGDAVDYLEFGVFEGVSMRQWLELNRHEGSRFFGFDSFEGLPEDRRPGQEKGHFSTGGVAPGINDSQVEFIQGWFEDTVPGFVRRFTARNRLVLHLDGDLYGSAMLPLVHFAPFMSQGTLLIFDEFCDREHEFKALTDWQRIYRRRLAVIAEMGKYEQICAELL